MTDRKLKDSNWTSARMSVMKKYDTNGDGIFDQGEVEGIIDDYMSTIYNQQALQDTNKSQRKIIIFGAIMIVLLSLSNLGTGIAAAYIAKDIKIVDGRMTAANGANEEGSALMTETSVRTVESKAVKGGMSSRRRMQAMDGTVSSTVACISPEMVADIYDGIAETGMVNLLVPLEEGLSDMFMRRRLSNDTDSDLSDMMTNGDLSDMMNPTDYYDLSDMMNFTYYYDLSDMMNFTDFDLPSDYSQYYSDLPDMFQFHGNIVRNSDMQLVFPASHLMLDSNDPSCAAGDIGVIQLPTPSYY